MPKMQPEMTKPMKVNNFLSQHGQEVLGAFKIIMASKEQTLEDALNMLRRRNVRRQYEATAKDKWNKLTFDPNSKSLSDLLVELDEGAEGSFGLLVHNYTLVYVKLTPILKRSYT